MTNVFVVIRTTPIHGSEDGNYHTIKGIFASEAFAQKYINDTIMEETEIYKKCAYGHGRTEQQISWQESDIRREHDIEEHEVVGE